MNKSIKELLLKSKSGYIKRNGATAESIALAERLLNTTFSNEYKDFLIWSNGGDFFDGGIELFAINDPTCPTHLLIGFINSPRNRPENIPKEYLIIGITIFGDYICLIPDGSIVQWDHEEDKAFNTYNSIYEYFLEFSKCCDPEYIKELFDD